MYDNTTNENIDRERNSLSIFVVVVVLVGTAEYSS